MVVKLALSARELTGESKLCLAGGVALNCVANGKVIQAGAFDEVWVQPAAGDAGGALGAALSVGMARGAQRPHLDTGQDAMSGSLLGPEYSDQEIGAYLDSVGAPYTRLEQDELAHTVAGGLAAGKIVGWHQGRMEFGPRALGARSILGDPRDPRMQATMNLKIKSGSPSARSRPRSSRPMPRTTSTCHRRAPTCWWSPRSRPGSRSSRPPTMTSPASTC